ncbi:MAG: biotin-dependent carboxyltransferase family protein [Chloroflexi bacterium]|nr:MAG: biotin-dependent carboxyltransferase family protein [Chloroflexota bacterium]
MAAHRPNRPQGLGYRTRSAGAPGARDASPVRPDRPLASEQSVLEVLAPGVLSTIQDGGRPNAAHLGVPPCGACDSWSFAIANLLMGNPADAPVLEITLAGPELLVRETCTIALTGSDLGATSVGEGRPLTPGIAHTLWAGSTVRFERAASADGPDGARAYLALAGGIDVPRVLGSASTCLVGGFGGIDGRALQPGDVLVPARLGDLSAAGRAWRPANRLGLVNASPIRVVPGPHLETVGMAALSALVAGDWRVQTESDRMAVRLCRSTANRSCCLPITRRSAAIPSSP